ncbi:hypothetical protein L210DRAFT_3534280 [Boletus edulis BED1]|uniref:Uncharacterized protein n=1 Tax=Boletus edulis BED1 TaxID=1328754 RepID=A0AAD4GCL4_BOLED|nr:hypothetical protein L210DRAFT_3555668 [Boletus edulis BED1]KAF8436533.1 hypothetical protein L210DRAFT_3548291 [Boletus edulis BED1]KAF8436969.1 hypothetical protein L210DRAFT_3548060 [Boletus edulis BED1]KAF8442867.1 hypothetical protein L210DRAFT_3534280 [Boletus edulis BED1]
MSIRASSRNSPELKRMQRECRGVSRTLAMCRRSPTIGQDVSANPRASSSRGRKENIRAMTTYQPATTRIQRDHSDATRMSWTCQASCEKRQNTSANTQRQGSRRTHPRELQSS